MDLGNHTISSTFAEIKQSLDPDYSYMLFEKPVGSAEGNDFQEIIAMLSRFEKEVLECEVQRDKGREGLALLVKLDPKKMDKISEEFLNIGLPKDVTFYVYGSRPEDSNCSREKGLNSTVD